MTKNWYVRVGEKTIGPVTTEQVIEALRAGKIQPQHLAREETEKTWREVEAIREIAVAKPVWSEGPSSLPASTDTRKSWQASRWLIAVGCVSAGAFTALGTVVALWALGYTGGLLGGPICDYSVMGDDDEGVYEATACSDGIDRAIICEIAPRERPGYDCLCVAGNGVDRVATQSHVETGEVPTFALQWVLDNELMYSNGRWPTFYARTCSSNEYFQDLRE